MELSSSQLTKSMIFQRGWNHQPVFYDHMFIRYNYIQLLYIIELYTYNLYTYIVLIYIYAHNYMVDYIHTRISYVCTWLYIYRFCKGVIFHCQVWLPECKNSEDPHISSIFFWEGARVYLRLPMVKIVRVCLRQILGVASYCLTCPGFRNFERGATAEFLPRNLAPKPCHCVRPLGRWMLQDPRNHAYLPPPEVNIGRFPLDFPIGKPHVFHRCFLMPFGYG